MHDDVVAVPAALLRERQVVFLVAGVREVGVLGGLPIDLVDRQVVEDRDLDAVGVVAVDEVAPKRQIPVVILLEITTLCVLTFCRMI